MPSSAVNPLPATYEFSIWAEGDQSYVSVPGTLAHVSDHLAFYENPANLNNFTTAEYEIMSHMVDDYLPELTRLMGGTHRPGRQRQDQGVHQQHDDGCPHVRRSVRGWVPPLRCTAAWLFRSR